MTQHDEQLIGTSLEIAKPSVDRLVRVGFTMPYPYSIIESTVNNGTFDTIDTLGLAAPDNAPSPSLGAAGNPNGTYSYYAAFYDNDRAVTGVISAQSGSVSPSNQQVSVDLTTITNESSVPRATHIRIYRNLDGGTTYYLLTTVTVATSAYTDNTADATLANNDEMPLDNAAPASQTYGSVLTHKNFGFMYGPYNGIGNTTYDDDFTWSKLSDADNWPTVNRTKINRGRYGFLTAAAPMGDDLVFYKQGAIYVLQFDTFPSGTTGDGYGKTVNTERGCVNRRCLINVHGIHFALDWKGIHEHKGGGNTNEIGRMFLERLWSRINWEQQAKFSGAHDDDIAVWTVALDRDTECKHAFVLDLKAYHARGEYRWSWYTYDFGIRDLQRIQFGPDTTSKQYNMARKVAISFITEYGYTGYMRAGFRDLADPQLTASATVTGGSTSTIVASAATFSRTNEASDTVSVLGCYGRFRNWEEFAADKPGSADWSQAYRITGVSGTTLTVSPTMPDTPPTGAIFDIGWIEARYRSPKIGFGAPLVLKDAKQLVVEYPPLGVNAQAKVRFRRDGRGWETVARTASEDHMDQTAGRDHAALNMGGSRSAGGLGVRHMGAPGAPFNYLEFEIDMSGVDQPIILDSLAVEIQ